MHEGRKKKDGQEIDIAPDQNFCCCHGSPFASNLWPCSAAARGNQLLHVGILFGYFEGGFQRKSSHVETLSQEFTWAKPVRREWQCVSSGTLDSEK